ncbi:MAG: aspartate--tRNA ligase [Candidatus Calescibacterium sp.]|nr:aspartate--tRNA ligase [Candidatus Calescibacterium sp.]MCX7734634.1 aspartate--tRNA ligase [bacterium]MDW8087016.1 aspartate--tRNA ligase [Candidatus Calescibacterium sp.]
MFDFAELKTSYKSKGCGQITADDIGKSVKLAGWIESIRDHGGVKFIDLVDITGEIQVIFRADDGATEEITEWSTVQIEGEVRRRPEGTENPKIKTGNVEVIAKSLKVLSKSELPPFLPTERKEVSEEIRLKYRYIDLRREKMRRNIIGRHLVSKSIREKMWEEGFVEIETPYLTKSTPEGARDFLVPSRLQLGKFYALPQSPQLFKQILQISGFERYFQIVRCFRDEDLRADRQPEFTQVDIEMSFVTEEDIISLTERVLKHAFKKVLDIEVSIPFPRIKYSESIRRYGTDKPDTRIPIEVKDISEIFSNSKLDFIRKNLERRGKVLGFSIRDIEIPKSKLVNLESLAKSMGAGGLMWFVIKQNKIISSPVIKHIDDKENLEISKLCDGNGIVFAISDREERARDVSAKLIKYIAKEMNLYRSDTKFAFVWVVEFPLFSWDETENRYVSEHHPFTSPKEEDLEILETNPEKVRARAYDIVLNGEEIGGGSIRIHNSELQNKIFRILKLSDWEVQERFGWFLEALKYGAPPHGGIALGLDRLVAIMFGEDNIREVIPFPKTQSGSCLLTNAPSDVYKKQLDELGIKIKEE